MGDRECVFGGSLTLVDRVELAATTEVARRHAVVSKELTAKRGRVIRSLQRSGLGTRDIAELLDLSQQRVSQIARGTR